MRGALVLLLALALVSVPAALASDRGESGALAQRVAAISKGLRCPVCQNLSIWDSPSAVAHAMRLRVRDLARQGRSDAEIRAYFVSRYGEWVLLSPPREGLGLVLWLAPAVILAAGLAGVGVAVARWRRRAAALAAVDPAALAVARAQLDELEEAS